MATSDSARDPGNLQDDITTLIGLRPGSLSVEPVSELAAVEITIRDHEQDANTLRVVLALPAATDLALRIAGAVTRAQHAILGTEPDASAGIKAAIEAAKLRRDRRRP